MHRKWIHALVAAVVTAAAQTAGAQCLLGPATPINDAALHHQVVEEVGWSFLSPISTGEYGQPYTLIDPLHPRRRAEVDNGVKLGVVTASRGIALQPYQQGKLFVGPLGPGARLTAIYQANDLGPVLDAVDGAAGETWVVLHARAADGVPGLHLHRIDAAGKIGAGTVVARGDVSHARIARLADGRLAIASVSFVGGRRYGVTSLRLAWLDAKGRPLRDPVRLDAVPDRQPVLDVAMAPSGKGIVVAWNPILRAPKGKRDRVPVELRAFHVEPQGAPRLTRRDALSGVVWRIPEAGGVLPNHLQAASIAGQAVLIWEQLASEQSMPLMAAPAEGGAATVIAPELRGNPLLRSEGSQVVIMFWDRNGYQHSRAPLTCKPGASDKPPMPLEPAPPDPTFKQLTRADLDQAWKHVEEIAAANLGAKDLLDELHKMGPKDRAEAEAKLTTNEARFECLYDCVMAGRTEDELSACDWP